MLVHWIWFATRQNVSDRMKVELLRHFQDPEEIYYAREGEFRHMEGLTEEGMASLGDKSLQKAESILHRCSREKLGIASTERTWNFILEVLKNL